MSQNGKKHRTIYDSLLIASVIMLLYIRPAIIMQLPIAGFFRFAMVVVSAILLGVFVLENKFVYKGHVIIFFGFFLARLFTTILNFGDITEWIKNDGILLAACVFFEIWLNKSPLTLFRTRFVFEILIVINYISLFLFPTGMYAGENYSRNWILGYNNLHIRIMLPGICLSMLCSYAKHGRMTLRPLLLFAVSVLSVLKVDSSTSIIGLAVFALLLFLLLNFDYKRILKNINLYSGSLLILIVDIIIVFVGNSGAFRYIIEELLGKEMTFTGRTDIWKNATGLFLKKPIFGYGYLSGEKYQRLLGYSQEIHPHNFLLYLLITGGIFLIAVFILMLCLSGKMLSSSKSPASKIILCAILAFFVMGISESLLGSNVFYPLFILAMNIDKIDAIQRVDTELEEL